MDQFVRRGRGGRGGVLRSRSRSHGGAVAAAVKEYAVDDPSGDPSWGGDDGEEIQFSSCDLLTSEAISLNHRSNNI